jgi:hypothetical protein
VTFSPTQVDLPADFPAPLPTGAVVTAVVPAAGSDVLARAGAESGS